jgi:hypothetical protein
MKSIAERSIEGDPTPPICTVELTASKSFRIFSDGSCINMVGDTPNATPLIHAVAVSGTALALTMAITGLDESDPLIAHCIKAHEQLESLYEHLKDQPFAGFES